MMYEKMRGKKGIRTENERERDRKGERKREKGSDKCTCFGIVRKIMCKNTNTKYRPNEPENGVNIGEKKYVELETIGKAHY